MYYLIIITSVICYTIISLFYASHSRKYGSLNTYVLRNFTLIILMLPLLFFVDFNNISLEFFVLAGISGTLGSLYFLLSIQSYKYLPAGIVSSIISLEALVVIILSYICYGEILPLISMIGAIILLLANIILSLIKTDYSHLNNRWFLGVVLVSLSAIGAGGWSFGFSYLSKKYDPFLSIYMSELAMFIFTIFIFIYIKIKQIKFNTDKENLKNMFKFSIIQALATGLFFYSGIVGKISISVMFLAIISILIGIIGHFRFKEKLNLLQWLLMFISFIGLILINL